MNSTSLTLKRRPEPPRDPVAATTEAARTVRHTLTRLGHAARRQDGSLWEVRFRDVSYYPPAEVAFLDVDVQALPRRVTTLALAAPEVLHELSTALGGYPVRVVNTTGLVFVVEFAPPEPACRAVQRLPERVDLDLATRPSVPYAVPLGVDGSGRPRWESLLRLLNVLVGGAPGGGKSGLLNAWLSSLTQAHPPGELRLSLVDPKGVDPYGWRGLPHVLGPIVETSEEAHRVLDLLRDEIDRRKPRAGHPVRTGHPVAAGRDHQRQSQGGAEHAHHLPHGQPRDPGSR